MKTMTYVEALNETFKQLMRADDKVFLIGQGVKSPWYVGATTVGLVDEFGEARVIDTPVSENAVTGAGIGAALTGMRPIIEHPRMDFMYLAMDQIMNHAANWHYMFGGQKSVPIVIWGIVNRGGEQAAQHSQALHATFAHAPGLKVVAPSTPADVKGLLTSAVYDDNPVLFMDERWLYQESGEVPDELFKTPIGQAAVRMTGDEVTIVGSSYMALEAEKAALALQDEGIGAEMIDVRTIKPLDEDAILSSVRKTGRLVVADGGWKFCGFAAEVMAMVTEKAFADLKCAPVRVTLPDAPAPASHVLEEAYYPTADQIAAAALSLLD